MAESVDCDVIGHGDAGAKHDIGFDQHIAANLRVPTEPHRFGRDQRGAIGHRFGAAAILPAAFGIGQFGAAVDPGHFVRVRRHHDRRTIPIGQRYVHNIGQIIFALRIIIAHPRQQREQITRMRRQQAGIAQLRRALGLGRVLELHHLHNGIALGNHPAIGQRIVRLKAQHNHLGRIFGVQPRNHRAHRFGGDKGHIAVQHQHIAIKSASASCAICTAWAVPCCGSCTAMVARAPNAFSS
jgi:hypothetical protein